MGCVKLNVTPGMTASASAMASISDAFVCPLVHCVLRVQVHVHVALVDAHGFGGEIGTTHLGDDLSHFRELPDDGFEARGDVGRFANGDRGQLACLDQDGAFIEPGHELGAEPGHGRDGDRDGHGRDGQGASCVSTGIVEGTLVAGGAAP